MKIKLLLIIPVYVVAQEEITFKPTAHGHIINIKREDGSYLSFTRCKESIKQWDRGVEQSLNLNLYKKYMDNLNKS